MLLLLSLTPPGCWILGNAADGGLAVDGEFELPVSNNLLKASTSMEGLAVTGAPDLAANTGLSIRPLFAVRLGADENLASVFLTGSVSSAIL